MISLAFEDDVAGGLGRSIDEISGRLVRAAAMSNSSFEFFEDAAMILFDQLPLQGVAIWLTPSRGGAAKLMGAAGNARVLDRPDCPLSDQSALRPRRTSPPPRDRDLNASSGLVAETLTLADQSRVDIAISLRADHPESTRPPGWLASALKPAIQLLETLTQAREAVSFSGTLVIESMEAFIALDHQGRCKLWNPAAEELFGWSDSDVLGRPLRIIPPHCQQAWRECTERVLKYGLTEQIQIAACRWDGREVDVDLRLAALRGGVAAVPNLLLCIRDQTPVRDEEEWRRISAAVADAAAAGGSVAECLRVFKALGKFDGATIWSRAAESGDWTAATGDVGAGSVSGCSPATLAVLRQLLAVHFTDLVGPLPGDLPTSDRSSTSLSSLLGVPLPDRNAVIVLEDSNAREISGAARESLRSIAAVIATVLSLEKLTSDLAKVNQRVIQAEKLEALGLLTTSVAHDLNNILTVIFGYADLARDGGASSACLTEIERAAEKAAQLTRQLLSSGRTSRNDVASFDVAVALREIAPLLKSLVGPKVHLDILESQGKKLSVRLPRTDFDQLVLNLVANARDSMPDGGVIRCRLASCEPSLRDLKSNPRLRPGPCVQICVVDSGCGMTDEVRERIFQAFFTTKDAGHGTGLGLAMVRQIVDRASGGITVQSRPGAGTAMTVLLPQIIAEICPRVVDTPPQADPCGDESVLVAHDDPRIRELLIKILELKGYAVRTIQNPGEAPETQGACREADLLLTDTSSLETMLRSCERKGIRLPPRLLVVSDSEADLPAASAGFISTRSLLIPFSSHQLAIAVRGALDDRRPITKTK